MVEHVVIVELGSNAARFLLARIKPGVGFRVLQEERVQTRLGGGRPGTLPRKAVEETVNAAHRFLAYARNGHNPRVLGVATSAVRDAVDRDLLLGALRKNDGLQVRILSGQEEARLGALAALWSLPMSNGVIADLGGASLQLTRVRNGEITSTVSLGGLGALRATHRFFRQDPPTPREIRALRSEIRHRILAALPLARRDDVIVGLGGSVRSIARIHLVKREEYRKHRHGLNLHQSDITAVRERLEALPLRERRRIPGLKAERADIILAGAIVIEELMLEGGYLTFTVCTRGVRDGLLLRETFKGV